MFHSDFEWVVASTGYQPFVAVRLESAGDEAVEICETQNEASEFVARLETHPVAKASLLLQGLCRALCDDVIGASEKFSEWLVRSSDSVFEEIALFAPDKKPFEAYVGYPIFSITADAVQRAGNRDRARRSALLDSISTAYARTTGNDSARMCIAQAATAALDGNADEVLLESLQSQTRSPRAAAEIFNATLQSVVSPFHRSMFWGDRLLTLDKSAAFLEDLRFSKAMGDVSGATGATQYDAPDGIAWRLHTLVWAAHRALHVPGDFVECGVYKGDMSWVVTELVDLAAANKAYFLYDTFEGFDPRYSNQEDFPLAPEFFRRADAEYRTPGLYEAVRDRFRKKPYVNVVKGSVPDVLRVECPDIVAFLHVDMNSPGPEEGALEILFDRVSPGGTIVLDDYGWILHRAQKDAIDRFMIARRHEVLELPTGQGLVIKR
jgi:O-methyltransferase